MLHPLTDAASGIELLCSAPMRTTASSVVPTWSSRLAVFAVAWLWALPTQAGPFDVADDSWEGGAQLYEIAKTELGPERVRPVATLDWSELGPDDGLLVMHPEASLDAGEASEFMKLGGRLAVVDDFGRGVELLRRFKIERVSAPSKPALMLRNNPRLAIAEPWLDAARGSVGAPHPVVANVRRMVLNHPSALVHPDLSPVLRVRALGEPEAIVAVAGQVGQGRLFAVSDPSALMNSMLRYPGNRAFAAGLVRYLAQDGERSGRGRLFVITNDFRQQGSVGGDSSLSDDLKSQLRALADSLADARREGLPPWLLALMAAVVVVGLALWVARSAGRPYRSPIPRYARSVPLLARGGVAGRFAMLAAPSSPTSLVLLELKSALFEALGDHYGLGPQPSREALSARLRSDTRIPNELRARYGELERQMSRVEAAMLAGSGARVSRETLDQARSIVTQLLDRVGALEPRAQLYRRPIDTEPPAEASGSSS
jgi:hypothetical protein